MVFRSNNRESSYYSINGKYVSYIIPIYGKEVPTINKKIMLIATKIVYFSDNWPENYSTSSSQWIDKNQKGFRTKLVPVWKTRNNKAQNLILGESQIDRVKRKRREILNKQYDIALNNQYKKIINCYSKSCESIER